MPCQADPRKSKPSLDRLLKQANFTENSACAPTRFRRLPHGSAYAKSTRTVQAQISYNTSKF